MEAVLLTISQVMQPRTEESDSLPGPGVFERRHRAIFHMFERGLSIRVRCDGQNSKMITKITLFPSLRMNSFP